MLRFFLFALLVSICSQARAANTITIDDYYDLEYLSPEEINERVAAGLSPNAYAGGSQILFRMVDDAFRPEDLQRIEALLDAGADVEAKSSQGLTALVNLVVYAQKSEELYRPLVSLLLKHDASIDYVGGIDIDSDGTVDEESQLLLAHAFSVGRGAIQNLRTALKLGARFSPRTDATFATPFFYAATYDDDGELASEFLSSGAEACFFPPEHRDKKIGFPRADVVAQYVVWEEHWDRAVKSGLEARLSAMPEVFSNLNHTRGICPEPVE